MFSFSGLSIIVIKFRGKNMIFIYSLAYANSQMITGELLRVDLSVYRKYLLQISTQERIF